MFAKICQKKILFLIFAAWGSLFLLLPIAALAIGQISSPIVIDNALRGQEFEQTLSLFNTEKVDLGFVLSAEGDIASWTSFYLKDDKKHTNPITSVDIKSGQRMAVIAVFKIPADTPNGEYKGLVSISSQPAANNQEDETVASIKQKISRTVSIKVSGKEETNLQADIRINPFSVPIGKKLKILVTYHNEGNVTLKPQVQVKTKQQEEIYTNLIIPYPEGEDGVKPLKTKDIPTIEIPTLGVKEGKLGVAVDILLNNKSIQHKEFLVGVTASNLAQEATDKNSTKAGSFSLAGILNKANLPIDTVVLLMIIIIIFLIIRIKKKNN